MTSLPEKMYLSLNLRELRNVGRDTTLYLSIATRVYPLPVPAYFESQFLHSMPRHPFSNLNQILSSFTQPPHLLLWSPPTASCTHSSSFSYVLVISFSVSYLPLIILHLNRVSFVPKGIQLDFFYQKLFEIVSLVIYFSFTRSSSISSNWNMAWASLTSILNGSENSLSSPQCSLKSENLCSNSFFGIPMSAEYFSYLTVLRSLVDSVVKCTIFWLINCFWIISNFWMIACTCSYSLLRYCSFPCGFTLSSARYLIISPRNAKSFFCFS